MSENIGCRRRVVSPHRDDFRPQSEAVRPYRRRHRTAADPNWMKCGEVDSERRRYWTIELQKLLPAFGFGQSGQSLRLPIEL